MPCCTPPTAPRKPDGSVRVALLASLDGERVVNDRDSTDDRATRKAGLRLMREVVRPHRRMMYLGIAAGLTWAIARVSVPTLAGEPNDDPSYALLGRLHAIGYMQGLREAAIRNRGARA